jgi:hypothetical protein
MTGTIRPTTEEQIETEAKTLQKFSQCAFDILQIVKTIIAHPGESKELNFKYSNLLDSLKKETTPAGSFKFKNRYSLPSNLIFISQREEREKKILYKAEKNLLDLLFRIEEKRRELFGEGYKANTGIIDLNLKQTLESIENSNTIQSPIREIQIVKNSKVEKIMGINKGDDILLNNEDGERLLTIGTKRVNIGSINNVANKLYECLLPIEVPKRVELVFDQTTPKTSKLKNDRDLTIARKTEILKERLKELQRITSKERVKVSLEFINGGQSVYMKIKEKSGG